MDITKDMTSRRKPVKASYGDKLFLLNFVMCTYLGPDVYSDNPRCSWFERLTKSLPPYSSNNLGSSFLRVSHLQSLYYYVLRNANSDLVFEPNMFYMYLNGVLPSPSSGSVDDPRQFTNFFPLRLHEHKKYANCEIVKGIVLIDDPDTSYLKEEDLERFKSLSGVDNLRIDADKCRAFVRSYPHEHQRGRDETELKTSTSSDDEREKASAMFGVKYQRRHRICDSLESTSSGPSQVKEYADPLPELQETLSQWTTNPVITGPPLSGSIVDIGESEVAYLFRVALPGVRTDFCELKCEIKSCGEVHIRGSVSGGQIIKKRSRVFNMRVQQLWPAGRFSVSFKLPGPVDPRLFSPEFRKDGIFEGVVIKKK